MVQGTSLLIAEGKEVFSSGILANGELSFCLNLIFHYFIYDACTIVMLMESEWLMV